MASMNNNYRGDPRLQNKRQTRTTGKGGRHRAPKHPYLRKMGFGVFVLILLAGIGIFAFLQVLESKMNSGDIPGGDGDKISSIVVPKDPFNILMMGTDARSEKGRGRSDTIVLGMIDPQKDRALLISIPRDTRVEVPGYGRRKINSAYSFGNVSLAVQTVQNFLGVKISHAVVVDWPGFTDIVDSLGGIDLDIERELIDEKNRIHIRPGKHHLNGRDALAYARFRKDARADLGRIERQQKFLMAVAKKAGREVSITRLPKFAMTLADNLTTDLSVTQIIAFARALRGIPEENIVTMTLPGEPKTINGASYVIADIDAIGEILRRWKEGLPLEGPIPTESSASKSQESTTP